MLETTKLTQKQLESKLSTDLNLMWDWTKEEPFLVPNIVVHRAYMLLSSLVLLRDFKYPTAINPTLRNSIQLEWSVLTRDDFYGIEVEYYFEFEVYEEKCSMLLAWEEPSNIKNPCDTDKVFRNFSCTFKNTDTEPFPMDIFRLFRNLEKIGEGNWLKIKKWFIEGDN